MYQNKHLIIQKKKKQSMIFFSPLKWKLLNRKAISPQAEIVLNQYLVFVNNYLRKKGGGGGGVASHPIHPLWISLWPPRGGAGGGTPPAQLGVWGSAASSPIGTWSGAPEANAFCVQKAPKTTQKKQAC